MRLYSTQGGSKPPRGGDQEMTAEAAPRALRLFPGAHRGVGEKPAAFVPEYGQHSPAPFRAAIQAAQLGLPKFPTTTIGSFPQTAEIRRARGDFKAGRIDENAYREIMRKEIARGVKEQEALGLEAVEHAGQRAGVHVQDLRERPGGGARHQAEDAKDQPLRAGHAELGVHPLRAFLQVVHQRPEQLHELQDLRQHRRGDVRFELVFSRHAAIATYAASWRQAGIVARSPGQARRDGRLAPGPPPEI